MSNKGKNTSETRSDDYPELTQEDFDRAVKRNGLKKKPAGKPAEEVRYEIRLEEFEEKMKAEVLDDLVEYAQSERASGKSIELRAYARKHKIPLNDIYYRSKVSLPPEKV